VIRVSRDDKGTWQIAQLPQVESAFVSVRPADGAILSLVGGFDFDRNKFNHVTQALRQPGSSFKPFIYSAALEKGFSPATVVNDAPLYFDATQTGSEPWEPKNYDGKFEGPMRLRTALMKSKNLVTVRVTQAIGAQYAQDYIARFGFDPKLHPAYLPMGLGAGATTPLQMVAAYAVFANGGYRNLSYRPRRRWSWQRAVQGRARHCRRDRRQGHRSAQRIHHDDDDARCRPRWDGGARDATREAGSRRQDGDDQRLRRLLVLRFQRGDSRRRVDRLRPAEDAG
jgi:membrane carboxypeptidase/penicillin-binding protein PbpC